MNKLRNNLHYVFWDFAEDKADNYPSATKQEQQEQQEVREETTEQTGELEEAIQEQEFPDLAENISGNIIAEESEKYTDMNKLKANRNRFVDRCKSKPKGSDDVYEKIWVKSIRDGFGHLISALKENNYFGDKKDDDLNNEITQIKEDYLEEVTNQYKDNIRYAGDKKFEGVKDVLFGRSSEQYPANKIYCKLTGATTIFNREKSKVTTYDVNPAKENDEKDDDDVESNTTKERKRFLAHKLPNYLWEVKDKTGLEKILGWTPIVSVKVDRPSLEDKKEIENFIKAVDRLEGNNPELQLLEIFDDLNSNATEQKIKQALTDHGLSLKKDKYIKTIKKAFQFYNSTQLVENGIRDQHAIYLSILQIVKNNGGFDKTISAFSIEVEEYERKHKSEGKEYKSGESLKESNPDLFNFAEKLGIKDYTSATRLANKSPEYFKNTNTVDILADINNDETINFADRGITKTGNQFKAIYEMIGEDIALPNLLAQAKLINNSVTNTEGIIIPEEEFTEEQIKNGNKKLIILLQNIISNPGQDLRTLLMYGPDAATRNKDVYEVLQKAPESVDDPRVQEAATKMLEGIDLTNVKLDNVQVASKEGLHQAVAGALYTEYCRGVGLGGNISFEEWVKGLSLNGGIQYSDKGVSIGLNLAYNREIQLGKGWTVSPGASVGFIPTFRFGNGIDANRTGSAGVELAKERINKNSVSQKIGARFSFTEVFGVSHVYSAFLGWERDKVKGIEGSKETIKNEFSSKIMKPLLDGIADNFKDKEFDLEVPENVILVETAVDQLIEKMLTNDERGHLGRGDIQRLKNNTVRYLINYNKAPISNEKVRQQIVNEMAEQYALSWVEERKNDIDGKTYLSDARIGFSWVQLGSQGVGIIHAGVGFKTQSVDIYGDGRITSHVVEATSNKSNWDENMINEFNKNMPKGSEFKLENGYIVVPKKAISSCNILINPEMKGLIKKDESGNVLLSTETYMNLPTTFTGAARRSTEVLIGGGDKSNAVKIETIMNDPSWFTEGDIDTTKLTGKVNVFTQESLDGALAELKAKLPDDTDFQNFSFDESIVSQLEQGKKYKITIEKKSDGMHATVQEVQDGEALQVEYMGIQSVELMSSRAQEIADAIYGEALKVKDNKLYNISHEIRNRNGDIVHRKRKDYVNFANAVREQKYQEARNILTTMLPKMDRYIGQGVKFSSTNSEGFNILAKLNEITDDVELGQAMLSINNVFARVSSVHGGDDGLYHFKKYENGRLVDRSIGDVIKGRAGEIERKINGSDLPGEAKDAYKSLINFAEKYRTDHPDKYVDSSRKGETLHNAIGINLGNSISIENPLFNPEVYEGSIIESNEMVFDGKDALQERAMRTLVENKSLMGPILSALNISSDKTITNIEYKDGKISIDIDGKNVILSADMKFAYFAQCVNHMLLLDNIYAEIPGEGSSVSFGPSVMGDGKNTEGTARTLISTTRTGIDVSITAIESDEPETPEEPGEPQGTVHSDPQGGGLNNPGGAGTTPGQTGGNGGGENPGGAGTTPGQTGGNGGGENPGGGGYNPPSSGGGGLD